MLPLARNAAVTYPICLEGKKNCLHSHIPCKVFLIQKWVTFNDPLPSCLRWMQSMWRVLQKVLKPGESYTQPAVWTHLELLWRELEHFNTEMQLRQRCTLSIHAIAHWNWEQKDVYQFLFHFLVDKCALTQPCFPGVFVSCFWLFFRKAPHLGQQWDHIYNLKCCCMMGNVRWVVFALPD